MCLLPSSSSFPSGRRYPRRPLRRQLGIAISKIYTRSVTLVVLVGGVAIDESAQDYIATIEIPSLNGSAVWRARKFLHISQRQTIDAAYSVHLPRAITAREFIAVINIRAQTLRWPFDAETCWAFSHERELISTRSHSTTWIIGISNWSTYRLRSFELIDEHLSTHHFWFCQSPFDLRFGTEFSDFLPRLLLTIEL